MQVVAKKDPEDRGRPSEHMSIGAWAVLVVLVALLAATMVVVYLGWTLGSEADVPITGYVAMAIGVVLSLAVGFGLMALVFYSSRKGYDEPPILLESKENNSESD
jgi:membrane protein DedA with SNARE-associated domain